MAASGVKFEELTAGLPERIIKITRHLLEKTGENEYYKLMYSFLIRIMDRKISQVKVTVDTASDIRRNGLEKTGDRSGSLVIYRRLCINGFGISTGLHTISLT